MVVKRGIETAVEAIVAEIKKQSRPVDNREQIAAVATISAADPEVGEIIAEVMDKVGKDGVITVEEGQSLGLETEYTEGMQFDRGYISAYFVTNPDRMEAVLENPLILITDKKISSVQDMLPGAREGRPAGQAHADHRRGRRRRGARHAGRQQAPRHRPGPRRQGAGLRRSPQGDAPRHRHPDRRHGHQRGDRAQARLGHRRGLRVGPPRRRDQGRHDHRRRRRRAPTRSRPA